MMPYKSFKRYAERNKYIPFVQQIWHFEIRCAIFDILNLDYPYNDLIVKKYLK
jgi:hypothetical protein